MDKGGIGSNFDLLSKAFLLPFFSLSPLFGNKAVSDCKKKILSRQPQINLGRLSIVLRANTDYELSENDFQFESGHVGQVRAVAIFYSRAISKK